MRLSEYLDVEKLNQHIKDGLVRRQVHNTLPLSILCYTRKCVFDQLWDDVTTKTRGLIVHTETGEIVARPFEKFHNIDTSFLPETHVYNLPTEQPIVTEKLDGNLAIYYRLGDYEGIASKGSFHSPHAEWGTKWYREHVAGGSWPKGYTPVFEQICEDIEHHVVHYGEYHQGLHLLSLIDNETGEEAPHWALDYTFDLVVPDHDKTVGQVLAENRPNTEGYVLTWPRPGQTPFRVKVKHEDFLRIQKVKNSLTGKVILEMLTDGVTDFDFSGVDSNLNDRVKKSVDSYRAQYFTIAAKSSALVKAAFGKCTTRKEFAEFFLKYDREVAPVCFKMLDQEDHKPTVWKIVKARTKNVSDTETGEEESE